MILNQAVFIKQKMYTRGKIISAENFDKHKAADQKMLSYGKKYPTYSAIANCFEIV